MLKSTHRVVAPAASSSLPQGWTEHKAPSGHLYYYNKDTKQSTYTRPLAAEPEPEELLIDYGATRPDREVQASMDVMQQFHANNAPHQAPPAHFSGGRGYQDRNRDNSRPYRQGDRPKSKAPIPNCAPWLLVKTKYGRRFVHNTDTKESLWKFPSDVMMAVIDMDRIEWERKKKAEEDKKTEQEIPAEPVSQTNAAPSQPLPEDYNSDEYEEVEVTDDEVNDGDPTAKRARLDESPEQPLADQPPPGPQEFDEDDIAWQLAQMEADEEDPGYDYEEDALSDEDGGIPLTKEDKDALFRTLLDNHSISPFSTFDALIDTNTSTANAVISDNRWTALPNMSSRRTAFDAWSRDRVAERNAPEESMADTIGQASTNGSLRKKQKLDPRIAYLRFLALEATPKLYWPEFKRKFRKAPEMVDRYFPDKDREKLYREYVTKLKSNDSDRKKDFNALLRGVADEQWLENAVPPTIEKDLRFYGVRDEQSRVDMVAAYRTGIPGPRKT